MPSSSFFRRPAVLLALALGALAAVVSILGKLTGGSDSGKATPLVSPRGAEAYPAFSPDGKRLVYSVRLAKGEGYRLFVRDLPNGGRRQLTSAAGSDSGPAWSPDGANVAFLRVDGERAQCMAVPAGGGGERAVADCGAVPDREEPLPAIAWTPDGKSLAISAAATGREPPAIALVPAEGGPAKRLTSPPEGTLGDSTPAVSPDGKTLAFVRSTSAEEADVYVCDLSGGRLERLTYDGQPIRGLAWMPDGGHLIYAGRRMGAWRLWRLPAGGSPTAVTVAGERARYPALAPVGGRLAYTQSQSYTAIWRAALDAHDAGQPLIRSAGREYAPSYSPDGRRIVDISDQTGADEIWLSDSEGGRRVQLTRFKGAVRPVWPRWSPDGQWLLYEARGMGTAEVDIMVMSRPAQITPRGRWMIFSAAGGKSRRLIPNAANPSWSHDGKTIYYTAHGQVWKAEAGGGGQQAFTTQNGVAQPEESLDGKYVYYRRWRSIWRIPVGGGAEEEIIQPTRGVIWAGPYMTRKGIYYFEAGRGGRLSGAVSFYDFATGKTAAAFEVDRADFSAAAVSPDGKYMLYPRVDQSDTNLMLVEGFR
ncbi:MAG: hypothetical protein ABSC23_08770 [Bryobacteraceae bacterium]|jgi:Tol biopolymer transport system component